MQASNFGGEFSFEIFYAIFTDDASLPLLYRSAKSQKLLKTQIKKVLKSRGSCLTGEVRRKINFTYVLGFVMFRDVVKSLSGLNNGGVWVISRC